MPKNIDVLTQSQLFTTTLPNSKGLMSHTEVAMLATNLLANKGLKIVKEEYRLSVNKEVAQGVYHLDHPDNDDYTGMMLVWVNSYDKTTGFRCEIGAYDRLNQVEYFVDFDKKIFRRNSEDLVKHTTEYVEERIDTGILNFKKFLILESRLKGSNISYTRMCELIGTMFFNDYLTSSQMIIIKKELEGGPVWKSYECIADTLSKCHPKMWFKQQAGIVDIIRNEIATQPEPAGTVIMSINSEEEYQSALKLVNDWFDAKPGDHNYEEVERIVGLVNAYEEIHHRIGAPDPKVVEAEEIPQAIAGIEPEEVDLPVDTLSPEFPLAPHDLPVSIIPPVKGATPLEEQVAMETVQPVTEKEVEVSKPAVVDEPKEESTKLVQDGKLQPNTEFDVEESSSKQDLDFEAEKSSSDEPEFDF